MELTEILDLLELRYRTSGYATKLFTSDRSLLLRLGVHPQDAQLSDLENIILAGKKQSTRAHYASRLKSLFQTLNQMKVIDNDPTKELPKIKKTRGVPKPITKREFQALLDEANEPYRDWFILAGYAGLRAMEVANIEGKDLEETETGYSLRILGKGGTDLIVPVAEVVAQAILKHKTLGRLWDVNPNKLSKYAADEMRRILGENAKHFHSLRHYFATTMLEKSGGDLMAVKELMRHTSVATTQIYTQLAQGRTRSLVDLL